MVKKWVLMLIVSGFFCLSIGLWEKDNFSLICLQVSNLFCYCKDCIMW